MLGQMTSKIPSSSVVLGLPSFIPLTNPSLAAALPAATNYV